MAKQGYGSNEFFNKVTTILKDKYSGEIASLQGDSVTLQHIKLQSLIMLEVLEELRQIVDIQRVQTYPPASAKVTADTKPTIIQSAASASGKS